MLVMKFQVECTKEHVWGPLAGRDFATFVKYVLLHRLFGVIPAVEKTMKAMSNGVFKISKG